MKKIYAGVRKGILPGKVRCDDRILVGNVVLDSGYYEVERDVDGLLLAVADGVGGSRAGWRAAQLACEEMRESLGTDALDERRLLSCLDSANHRILSDAMLDREYQDMKSTLSLFRADSAAGTVLQLGDSRIYCLKDTGDEQELVQLTEDQNLLLAWKQEEDLSEDRLKERKGWNRITSFMGMHGEVSKRVQVISGVKPEGIFLLTSDGVHDFLEREQLQRILLDEIHPREQIMKMMDFARENGSKDDQSVIIVR